MITLLSPHSPQEVAGTILVLQVRNSNPSYSEPSCEVLKTLSFGYSEAQVLFVLTPCFISLIFCRARVLFPQGPSLPTCRVQPLCASFMNSVSALCLGSVPALVRTTAQKPLAVSGEAFVSSHPQPRLLPLALCAVHRMEEKEGRQSGTGGGEAATCRLSSGSLSACSLPGRGKAEIPVTVMG